MRAAAFTNRSTPSPCRLREDFIRRQNRLTAVFAFALTSALLVWIWLVASGFVAAHPWVVGSVLVFFSSLMVFRVRRLFSRFRRRISIEEASREDLGTYSRASLLRVIDDVRQAFPSPVQPPVYLLRPCAGGHANGFAVRTFFSRLVPAWRAVYITSDLLSILKPPELRAVLAHEFAHFQGLNNLPGRAFMIMPFVKAAPVLACFALSPWLVAAGFFAKSMFIIFVGLAVQIVLVSPHNRMRRDEELLADFEASRRFGALPMINALLCIAERGELVSDVFRRALLVAEASANPLAVALAFDCVDSIPCRPIRPSEATTLMSSVIREKQRILDDMLRKAKPWKAWTIHRFNWLSKVAKKRMLKRYRDHDSWQKTDWRRFDTNRRDEMLDDVELRAFISELMRDQTSGVVLTSVEHEAVTSVLPNRFRHPSFRDRIMFLERSSRELAWIAAGYRHDGFLTTTFG